MPETRAYALLEEGRPVYFRQNVISCEASVTAGAKWLTVTKACSFASPALVEAFAIQMSSVIIS